MQYNLSDNNQFKHSKTCMGVIRLDKSSLSDACERFSHYSYYTYFDLFRLRLSFARLLHHVINFGLFFPISPKTQESDIATGTYRTVGVSTTAVTSRASWLIKPWQRPTAVVQWPLPGDLTVNRVRLRLRMRSDNFVWNPVTRSTAKVIILSTVMFYYTILFVSG